MLNINWRTGAEAEASIHWPWCDKPTHWKRHWCWERLRVGREGATEDEMIGWHHWLRLSKLREIVKDKEAWRAAVCAVAKSRTQLHDWTTMAIAKCFPFGSSGKKSACQFRRHSRHRLDPWVGKIPWSKKWQPTAFVCVLSIHTQCQVQRLEVNFLGVFEEDKMRFWYQGDAGLPEWRLPALITVLVSIAIIFFFANCKISERLNHNKFFYVWLLLLVQCLIFIHAVMMSIVDSFLVVNNCREAFHWESVPQFIYYFFQSFIFMCTLMGSLERAWPWTYVCIFTTRNLVTEQVSIAIRAELYYNMYYILY